MEIEEGKEPTQPYLLPDGVKWRIIWFKKNNLSNKSLARGISQTFQRTISHQTVQRIWTKYEETGMWIMSWTFMGDPRLLVKMTFKGLLKIVERIELWMSRNENTKLETLVTDEFVIDFFINSIPRRIKAMSKSGGRHIRYWPPWILTSFLFHIFRIFIWAFIRI